MGTQEKKFTQIKSNTINFWGQRKKPAQSIYTLASISVLKFLKIVYQG